MITVQKVRSEDGNFMRQRCFVIASLFAGISMAVGCAGGGDHLAADAPQKDLLSYGAGYNLGRDVADGLTTDGIEPNADLLVRGFADGLNGNDPIVDRVTLDRVLEIIHDEMQARMVRRELEENPEFRKLSDNNAARSRAHHEALRTDPGVTTSESGVQYRVIESGDGASPGSDDTVIVSYTMLSVGGSVVDERIAAEVRISEIIEGGAILLQMMRVGDKWEVAIPPALAFGAAGDPPMVGPNEVILGEVELLEILSSGE